MKLAKRLVSASSDGAAIDRRTRSGGVRPGKTGRVRTSSSVRAFAVPALRPGCTVLVDGRPSRSCKRSLPLPRHRRRALPSRLQLLWLGLSIDGTCSPPGRIFWISGDSMCWMNFCACADTSLSTTGHIEHHQRCRTIPPWARRPAAAASFFQCDGARAPQPPRSSSISPLCRSSSSFGAGGEGHDVRADLVLEGLEAGVDAGLSAALGPRDHDQSTYRPVVLAAPRRASWPL